MRPQAVSASFGFDVRDSLFLVIGRFYYQDLIGNRYLPRSGLYECILGVVRESGTGGESSAQSFRVILESACTLRQGRRDPGKASGSEDSLDTELYEHVKARLEIST